MNTRETKAYSSAAQYRLPAYLTYLINRNHLAAPDDFPSLENLKREYIRYLLQFTSRNLNETARILSISRGTLIRKLKRFQLDP